MRNKLIDNFIVRKTFNCLQSMRSCRALQVAGLPASTILLFWDYVIVFLNSKLLRVCEKFKGLG